MTKLSTERVLPTEQIAATKSYQDLNPFFTFFSRFLDNMARIVTKGVGLIDNVDCDVPTVTVKSGVPLAVRVKRLPIGVTVLSSSVPQSQPLFWVAAANSATQIEVTMFLSPSLTTQGTANESNVTLAIFYS